jgi:carbon-monoxide dehydrogenase large subunit
VLFPGAGTNVAASFGDAAGLRADLFDGCDVVVTRTIVNQRVAPAPMEPRAAGRRLGGGRPADGVDPEPGRAGHRAALADMLGHRPGGLRVITPDVGGAFGAKFGATRSTRWCAGWPGSSAVPRAGPRPGARTWSG